MLNSVRIVRHAMLSEVGIPFEPMESNGILWIIWGMTRVCITCHLARCHPLLLISQILESADRLLIYGSHLLEDGPPKKWIQTPAIWSAAGHVTRDGTQIPKRCPAGHQRWRRLRMVLARRSWVEAGTAAVFKVDSCFYVMSTPD